MPNELTQLKQVATALKQIDASSDPLFITGPAGSGKSALLQKIRDSSVNSNIVVLAPTGIAALNIRGTTIHRFFSFPISITPQIIQHSSYRARRPRIYRHLNTILIDESSMLRADLVDCMDAFLRRFGPRKSMPFGGVCLVFFGDLYQLPPVVTHTVATVFSEGKYQSPYFFSAHVFRQARLRICSLKTIYRQNDPHFIGILNRIRTSRFTKDDLDNINDVCVGRKVSNGLSVTLTTVNSHADQINTKSLNLLQGEANEFTARHEGEATGDGFPTEKNLVLKKGAQVMMISNDPHRRWVNGTLGHVEDVRSSRLYETSILVRLQENTKRVVSVVPFSWDVHQFFIHDQQVTSRVVGRFIQFPLRLAWAFTIHKSQGKTYDNIVVDLSRGTFAPGQLYVALSRCRTLEGISLSTPISERHIRLDPKIGEFFDQNQDIISL